MAKSQFDIENHLPKRKMENMVVFRVLLNDEDIRVEVPEFSEPTIFVSEVSVNIVSTDSGIVYASFPPGTPVFFSYEETYRKEP